MSEIRDHVAYLSQTIGPRPAGTEEEQQAALYITEKLQNEAGLPAVIEDFNCNPDYDIPKAICSGVAVLVAIVAMIVPMMTIPAFILTLLAAGLYIAESFDRPIISRFFNKGVSQNVVAKYEPEFSASTGSSRRRKVILVAHYDSGKVRKELSSPLFAALPVLKWVALGGMAALPVLFLLRCFISFGGVALIVINIVTALALACALMSLLNTILLRTSAYNEGANCNAAGVAVLMDVATRIGRGRVSAADLEKMQHEEPVMHGEGAVVDSGLVPEGAELVYDDVPIVKEPEIAQESPAARLAAAKAAVAAMTGKPVSNTINIDIYDNLVQVKEPPVGASSQEEMASVRADAINAFASVSAAASGAATAVDAGAAVAVADAAASDVIASEGISGAVSAASFAGTVAYEPKNEIPDWFVKAQQKAKKPTKKETPVQRSRYADALDAAMRESSVHFQEANDAVVSETEARLQQMRNSIMEVKAPGFEREELRPMPSYPTQVEGSNGAVDAWQTDAFAVGVVESQADNVADTRNVMRHIEVNPQEAEFNTQREAAETGFSGFDKAEEALVSGQVSPSPAVRQLAAEADHDAAEAAPSRRETLSAALSGVIPSIAKQNILQGNPRVASRRSQLSEVEAAGAQRLSSQVAAQPAAQQISSQSTAVDGSSAAMPRQFSSVGEATVSQSDDVSQIQSVEQSKRPKPRKRRSIALPNIGATQTDLAPLAEGRKQHAPLADGPKPTGRRSRNLRAVLPSIGEESPAEEIGQSSDCSQDVAAEQSYAFSANQMETSSFDAIDPREFEPLSTDSSFEEYAAPYDYAEDDGVAFDAGSAEYDGYYSEDYEEPYGEFSDEEDSPAATGYVEMPKSRAQRFMDKLRFGKKKRNEVQSTPQEWLDVDDEFDARSAGAARGGWESFRQEDSAYDAPAGEPYESAQDGSYSGGRRWNGGAFSRDQLGRVSTLSEDMNSSAPPVEPDEIAEELEQIYHFRHPDINTEVWFVALGSELAANGGMRAFLAEHAADLKGSVIVELDGMGAGELRFIGKEGLYQPRAASSRMKRYAKKAAQALGMSLPEETMLWKEGSAAYAMKRGYQAMHVAGIENGKPALCAQKDDVLGNVSEDTMLLNSDFVMELLKQI